MIADGCIILKSHIEHSIVGVRSFIGSDCEIRDTIIMGCDFYETQHQMLEQDVLIGVLEHLVV